MCIGLDIHKDFRGKKLAEAIYVKLLNWCFRIMEYNRVWLMVADFNIRAKNLYTKMGFVLEGRQREALYRFGSYHDYLIMSILRKEYNCDTFI
jgi:RimJ/RimL family protein N-acetyltransferase